MPKKLSSLILTVILPLALVGAVLFLSNSKKNLPVGSQQDKLTGLSVPVPAPKSIPVVSPSPKDDNTLGTQSADSNNMSPKTFDQPPAMQIDQNKKYSAVLKTTAGDITIELNAKTTPITVNNFVFLAKNNFYDNTIFHRVIKGFMIQGGDPKGDGTGGPGYRFADESITGDYTRGTVAMANAGPNTNGSQFFIMHADYNLPKNYVIFGKVTSGIDVVDKIANAPVQMSPSGEDSQPVTPIKITAVEVKEE